MILVTGQVAAAATAKLTEIRKPSSLRVMESIEDKPDRDRPARAAGGNRRRKIVIGATAGLVILAVVIFAFARLGEDGPGQAGGEKTADTAPATTGPALTGLKQMRGVTGPGPLLTPAPAVAPVPAAGLAGKVICIDPGHAATTDAGMEPIGPGSPEMKVKDPGGTSGVVSGVREPVVTLAISLQLRAMLEAQGATVVMTRSGADFSGGNRERAEIANQAGADLLIRIHADGSADSSRRGVSTLYPANIPGWTDDIYASSLSAANAVQAAMVSQLGAVDLGTVERSDISGFNWADVPAVLVETGFMSNPEEDALLNDPAYQQQVAAALAAGISAFFS